MAAGLLPDVSRPTPQWDDHALVDACLRGSEAAWVALIDKYARMILAVPLRFRFSMPEAEDIFQAVCVDLIEQLASVREPAALRGWLVRVATHKCLHARRRLGREELTDPSTLGAHTAGQAPSPERVLADVEQQQLVRDAMAQLSERCRRLLHLLFASDERRSYDEVAREFGVARNSVSFLRSRCLHRLHRTMLALGFDAPTL
jgi:RNA polymerase sigma factor (sigma-70 family)